MNQLRTAKTPLAAAPGKKNPDVIVSRSDQTALFKMKNPTVSEWMRKHYHSTAGGSKGGTVKSMFTQHGANVSLKN